jgi:hypothetical protein
VTGPEGPPERLRPDGDHREVSQQSTSSSSDRPRSRNRKGRDSGKVARLSVTSPQPAPPVVSPVQGLSADQPESSSSHAPESSSSRLSRIAAHQARLVEEQGRSRDLGNEGPGRGGANNSSGGANRRVTFADQPTMRPYYQNETDQQQLRQDSAAQLQAAEMMRNDLSRLQQRRERRRASRGARQQQQEGQQSPATEVSSAEFPWVEAPEEEQAPDGRLGRSRDRSRRDASRSRARESYSPEREESRTRDRDARGSSRPDWDAHFAQVKARREDRRLERERSRSPSPDRGNEGPNQDNEGPER